MNWNDKLTPTPAKNLPQEKNSTENRLLQTGVTPEDNEEDQMLTEGYLPEIYFTLKSDNPADW